MPRKSKFERDFVSVEVNFPKLSYSWSSKLMGWLITGSLDICDSEGDYWNTFKVTILIPKNYPHCVPIIMENSEIIPRDIDWHISKEGICCIDHEYALIIMSRKGININTFIKDKIYPYFANQLFRLTKGKYAGKEYLHHFDGTLQFYIEDLDLKSPKMVAVFLERILKKYMVGRNNLCPCGIGKKIKECHLESIETIKLIGKGKIEKDLQGIRSAMSDPI